MRSTVAHPHAQGPHRREQPDAAAKRLLRQLRLGRHEARPDAGRRGLLPRRRRAQQQLHRRRWPAAPSTTVGTPNDGAWRADTRGPVPFSTFDARNLGLYAQDTVALTPTVKLIGGLRFDHFKASYRNPDGREDRRPQREPVVAAPRRAVPAERPGVLLRVLRHLVQHLGRHLPVQPTRTGNAATANTPPEKSRNIEIGGKFEMFERRALLGVAVFYSEKYNERNTDPDTAAAQQLLSGKRHAAGVEFNLAGRITPKWEVFFNHTWIPEAKIDESNAAAGRRTAAVPRCRAIAPRLTPTHSGSLWTTYRVAAAAAPGRRPELPQPAAPGRRAPRDAPAASSPSMRWPSTPSTTCWSAQAERDQPDEQAVRRHAVPRASTGPARAPRGADAQDAVLKPAHAAAPARRSSARRNSPAPARLLGARRDLDRRPQQRGRAGGRAARTTSSWRRTARRRRSCARWCWRRCSAIRCSSPRPCRGSIFNPLFNRYGGDSQPLRRPRRRRRAAFAASRRSGCAPTCPAPCSWPSPHEYDGGELVIREPQGERRIKLPAGDMVLYPGTTRARGRRRSRAARASPASSGSRAWCAATSSASCCSTWTWPCCSCASAAARRPGARAAHRHVPQPAAHVGRTP